MTARVFVVNDTAEKAGMEAATNFFAAVDQAVTGYNSSRVGFDCEGVDLSKAGTLEVVSLCFEGSPTDVYLVDLGSASSQLQQRVAALKRLFQCGSVTKVIHDCKMDCDALYHLYGIQLSNVHDTSCYHHMITVVQDANLNTTLQSNTLQINDARDNNVYRANPAFWATRPMTQRMITWASSDVDTLLILASKQSSQASDLQAEKARTLSASFCSTWQLKLNRSLQCRIPIGRFIGRGGSNMRSLQRSSGALIYYRSGHQWLVFYPNETSLAMVRNAMGY